MTIDHICPWGLEYCVRCRVHTIVTLTLSDGTAVETTDAHPWWDATTRTYTRTDHLAKGDQVLTADGTTLTVAGVSGPQGAQPVTNLTITGPHTYYVTNTSILVHNCGYTPSGGFAESDLDEVAQTVYQHIGAGDVANRPSLAQISEALAKGTAEDLIQGDGTLARVINYKGIRVIINENNPLRSTAYVPGR